jgi:tetratricopeptide (TPR) repeat protein
MQSLATVRFQQGEYREGEKCLASLLAMLPAAGRRGAAEQFGWQFESAGKTKDSVRAWTFLGWTFATSPEPRMRDAKAALDLSQRAVALTKRQDPLALDTLAAAQAAGGHYNDAVQTAQAALTLANSQGNTRLAEAIARRVALYRKASPCRSDPNGSDRP